MRFLRVGPWGPNVRVDGAVARGTSGWAGHVVSCGSINADPPFWRPLAAAAVHIRSDGRDREAESAEETGR